MSLETGTYISDLVTTNPTATDAKSQGDDHLRLIKSVIKTTFPNVTGAMTASHTELNDVVGATSSLQTQINTLTSSKGAITGQTWTGTHTFPSATYGVTAAPGASGTGFATIDYVNNTYSSPSLPGQTNKQGNILTTDGSNTSFHSLIEFPEYWM